MRLRTNTVKKLYRFRIRRKGVWEDEPVVVRADSFNAALLGLPILGRDGGYEFLGEEAEKDNE